MLDFLFYLCEDVRKQGIDSNKQSQEAEKSQIHLYPTYDFHNDL